MSGDLAPLWVAAFAAMMDRVPRTVNEPAPLRDWRVLSTAAVIALVAALLLWPSGLSGVENLDSRGTGIVAVGDSLTAGYGAGAGEDYPSLLGNELGISISNAGRSGDTTAGALARLEDDVLSENPRIVIVGLGGNDFLRGVPISATEENLRRIVETSQQAGAIVVLLGFEFPGLRGNYGAMYERIAEEEGALLIPDLLDGILADSQLRSDAIHPNAAGYEVMAGRIEGPLRRLIDAADAAR